jgi:hypothetical protein
MSVANDPTPQDQLVGGHKYQIVMEDCCVSGYFDAVFKQYYPPEDPEKAIFESADLDHLYGWSAFEITEEES